MVRCPECPESSSLDVDWHPDPPDDRSWLICSRGHAFVKEQEPVPPPVVSPERHPVGGPILVTFDHDDDRYLEWASAWPRGYVLNSYRHPSPDYVPLHRAYCHSITVLSADATTFTRANYIKFCSTSRHLVDQWARESTGVSPSTGCHCVNS